jgi:orotidine-5'-phosphate decarboxylase
MTALEKLNNRIRQNYHISVGLDTDLDKIPAHIKKYSNPLFEFNRRIIDATYKEACAYKLNYAFYERFGAEGFRQLKETIDYIPSEVLTIADSKRGDIGNTANQYAKSTFEYFNSDAVTLAPYMGFDSIEPFVQYNDKLNFILALTSNKSSSDFEKQKMNNGKFLYQTGLHKVNEWNKANNLGVVFGATNPNELSENFRLIKNLPVLLPGIGAQGGDLEKVVKIFKQNESNKFVINVSRSLIFADDTENFADKSNEKLIELNKQIDKILS